VDTSSSFSLLPYTSRQRGPVLRAADGRRIPCWGFANVPIKLEGEPYSWSFLRATVKFPILGIDFLRHFRLLVDAPGNRLLPQQPEHQDVTCNVLTAAPPAAAAQGDPWSAWLQEFPDLAGEMTTDKEASHGVHHSIETVGCPVTAKFCRLDPERLAAAKAVFSSMLKAGIIRRSSSQWASPLHLVKKKDGSWRPCGDFRLLNLITTADKYPLPNMADFAARLDGCRVFSKLDLNKVYLQVPVAEADIPKTALITPFGLFEFVRMPFSLKSIGMTLRRMMDAIFADLPFVFIYLDDVLIASRSAEEHQHHLRLVFQLLSRNGLLLNVAKCVLAADSIDFLGHRITAAGIQPLPHRVTAISTFPLPRTVKDLQAFLGLFNFYRPPPSSSRSPMPCMAACAVRNRWLGLLPGGPPSWPPKQPWQWHAGWIFQHTTQSCHWIPTLPPPTPAQSYSSGGKASNGDRWGSSLSSWTARSKSTAPSTGSY
jgi:Reverse transcriptase (RNA-dependent DNA polymerase)